MRGHPAKPAKFFSQNSEETVFRQTGTLQKCSQRSRIEFTLHVAPGSSDDVQQLLYSKRLSIVVFSSAFNFDQMEHISPIQKWQNYLRIKRYASEIHTVTRGRGRESLSHIKKMTTHGSQHSKHSVDSSQATNKNSTPIAESCKKRCYVRTGTQLAAVRWSTHNYFYGVCLFHLLLFTPSFAWSWQIFNVVTLICMSSLSEQRIHLVAYVR